MHRAQLHELEESCLACLWAVAHCERIAETIDLGPLEVCHDRADDVADAPTVQDVLGFGGKLFYHVVHACKEQRVAQRKVRLGLTVEHNPRCGDGLGAALARHVAKVPFLISIARRLGLFDLEHVVRRVHDQLARAARHESVDGVVRHQYHNFDVRPKIVPRQVSELCLVLQRRDCLNSRGDSAGLRPFRKDCLDALLVVQSRAQHVQLDDFSVELANCDALELRGCGGRKCSLRGDELELQCLRNLLDR